MVKLEKLVLMATIGAPHGVKGELYVKSYASDPANLGRYGSLYSDDGRKFTIQHIYEKSGKTIILFDGINNRDIAKELHKLELYIKRRDFYDEELEEDEFFYADLEGLKTFDLQGKYWGTVSGVYDFGAGTVLELYLDSNERNVMIPFIKAVIPNINIEDNKLLFDPIAAGLTHAVLKDEEQLFQPKPAGDIP
ncbi:ribosome maturation factor RimM [Candidatus Liberibacter sp.]|uniref:ribosome maturation factor RimM n=1 Tax=Candidatus Liberibacter sp. TaxID=34022 RepID=UPI0015F6FAED|nr:ribosome maturation factor RimM [Candidatus Liberibacter sp.]MBA5723945.1 ribosome maturation factor RimM [Candidatus Liberibacter sp.]